MTRPGTREKQEEEGRLLRYVLPLLRYYYAPMGYLDRHKASSHAALRRFEAQLLRYYVIFSKNFLYSIYYFFYI